jgi:hypothetical protein
MANQLLIYIWREEATGISQAGTAPQFRTTATLAIEARIETKAADISATLPDLPEGQAVDAKLDALVGAVKKAILCNIAFIRLLESVAKYQVDSKYDDAGQRVLGQGGIAIDLVYPEVFDPSIDAPLVEIDSLLVPATAVDAGEDNQGNGTLGAVTLTPEAVLGIYAIAFTSPDDFTVTGPNAVDLGTGTVGTAFAAGGIAFTIAAGSDPFAEGDSFGIALTAAANFNVILPS